jgi:GT2 family glycosyltransferase
MSWVIGRSTFLGVRRIAVILTCFNRREITLTCLDRLKAQTAVIEDLSGNSDASKTALTVFLVDDGSTDGTGEAVRATHPEVHVIEGTGDLFWNRGMHLAWATAIEHGGFDHYFLLNDDTILFPDALEHLIHAAETPEDGSEPAGLAVGATTHPETGEFTYGGYVRDSKWNPMKLRHRKLSETDRVETMNCNAVLVPDSVVGEIGQMDPAYHHSWGDIDLGYRASKAGFVLSVPSVPIGYCEPNPQGTDAYNNPALSLRERIAYINSIRGLNKADWMYLVRRHGGPAWPLVWASPYINLFLTWGRQKVRR